MIDYAHRFGITSNIPAYLPVALVAAESNFIRADFGIQRVSQRWRPHPAALHHESGRLRRPGAGRRFPRCARRDQRSYRAHHDLHAAGGCAARNWDCRGRYEISARRKRLGTTNDFTDAKFIGFSPSLTAGVWIGYDEKKSLGAKESGARAALPIWMDFMKVALAGKDPGEFQPLTDLPQRPVLVDTMDSAPAAEESH